MRRFPARVLLSTGGSCVVIVAVNFEAFQALPPFEFKLMTAMLRYVNRSGECHPALRQLADDVLASEATVSRAMTRLEERGCFSSASAKATADICIGSPSAFCGTERDASSIDRVVHYRDEQASIVGADIAAPVLFGAIIGAAVAVGPGGEIAVHAQN